MIALSGTANLRLALLTGLGGSQTVTVHDPTTGQRVGSPVGGDLYLNVDVSGDGSPIGDFNIDPGTREGDSVTYILDGDTGEEIFHLDSNRAVQALTFDSTTGELIAALKGGRIMTIDLTTREVVSDVETTTTSEFLDVGVRSDGLIVAASAGQIELVDRRTGPTGTTVDLPNVIVAIVREDGNVVTITAENQIEVIHLDSNALIEQTWEVDSFANIGFNAGRAAVLNQGLAQAEIIDLATGDRSTVRLRTSEGSRFSAEVAYPEPDGVWAISRANVLARWEGEHMVEQIYVGSEQGVARVTGMRHGDEYAVLGRRRDGTQEASLVSLERSKSGVLLTVETSNGAAVHPTLDGGLHVLDVDGTLRTYDAAGVLTGEVATGAEDVRVIALDPSSGKLAIGARAGGVFIVNPATQDVEIVPEADQASNLGFGRNGELLAIAGLDGTVRLWDVQRGASAGVVWDGTGAVTGASPWYDETTESLWMGSSGKLLQVPMNPQAWVERACEIVGRDLTQDEWDRLVSRDQPLQSACS